MRGREGLERKKPMSLPPESREEAIKRLTESASSLEARTAREISHEAAGQAAASQAWRIIADLLGGVFVGLALGAGVDWYFQTNPWGLIGGVLLGFAVSIWMAWRTAQRVMAMAKASGEEPKSVPFDEDEED
jgi:ATP synthase protein I